MQLWRLLYLNVDNVSEKLHGSTIIHDDIQIF